MVCFGFLIATMRQFQTHLRTYPVQLSEGGGPAGIRRIDHRPQSLAHQLRGHCASGRFTTDLIRSPTRRTIWLAAASWLMGTSFFICPKLLRPSCISWLPEMSINWWRPASLVTQPAAPPKTPRANARRIVGTTRDTFMVWIRPNFAPSDKPTLTRDRCPGVAHGEDLHQEKIADLLAGRSSETQLPSRAPITATVRTTAYRRHIHGVRTGACDCSRERFNR